jgi:hypothetical protein
LVSALVKPSTPDHKPPGNLIVLVDMQNNFVKFNPLKLVNYKLLLATIIIAGLMLRLYQLGTDSFWIDEVGVPSFLYPETRFTIQPGGVGFASIKPSIPKPVMVHPIKVFGNRRKDAWIYHGKP